jgi:hypothetical protein
MRKLIFTLMLGLFFTGFANAKVLFDPATYVPVDSSQSIDTIDGVLYLKVRLNGWNTNIDIPQFIIPATATSMSVTYKYSPDTTTPYTNANTEAFIQLMGISGRNIGTLNSGVPSSDTLFLKTGKPMADTIKQIQLAGFQHVSWNAIVGSIIWISKIEVVEPFDLTTFEGDVPTGATFDTIDGTQYLKVRLDGWNTAFAIAPIIVANIDTVKYTYKYSPDTTSTYTNANTEAFVQFMKKGTTASNTGVGDFPSSDTLKPLAKILKADTFNVLQLAGFQHVSWNAINGPLMWLSKFQFVINPWTTFPISKLVFGTKPTNYKGSVKMKWDVDSLYLHYDVTDDSIVNTGAAYQVDNIEIYVDMNNSKDIHWPRNGGWVKSVDAAYDTVDYQFRLVPNVPFATNNTARPGGASIASGYNQVYTRTADGYAFDLNVAWDKLKKGFVPAVGTKIGYDNDISDNDKVASDANRNQFTFNSPTPQLFNDPSLWGTLTMSTGGAFVITKDITKPSIPSNVKADTLKGKVVVTWDASTDNIALMKYLVFNGTDTAATVYAKQTGNSATLTLANGTYTLGVAAVDNSGNTSNKKTVSITVNIETGINAVTVSALQISPNPANEYLNISVTGLNKTVRIYDLTGKLVIAKTINGNGTISVSSLKAGLYFVKANGLTAKFIKL